MSSQLRTQNPELTTAPPPPTPLANPPSPPHNVPKSKGRRPGSRMKLTIPHKITIAYLLAGGLWILFSDRALEAIVSDPHTLTRIQTFKGWAYVAITGLLLFAVIRLYFDRLERAQRSLEDSYDATLKGWALALDLRDHDTEEHTLRVTDLTLKLAAAMGIREPELTHIRRGALLHDIGKMAIPDSILLKPDKLTDDERAIMRQHPDHAYHMLATIPHLVPALDIPRCHHERWDGTGYPRALRGDQIPLPARIFAVIDVYDALTSKRPYGHPMPPAEAIAYIESQSGKHFDPAVVTQFLKLIQTPAP
ncbi:MAG: HD domain-containing protein [Candidatus Sumerlaeaceae bacterium]|nr:HD domain-containing protein [Candidatus Sumerlaeaceae bacterium]